MGQDVWIEQSVSNAFDRSYTLTGNGFQDPHRGEDGVAERLCDVIGRGVANLGRKCHRSGRPIAVARTAVKHDSRDW